MIDRRRRKQGAWVGCIALLTSSAVGTPAAAATASPNELPAQVAQAIAERRSRVQELRLIREAAEELGFRAWLFGGTAAGFAHYVRWDLAREAGDPRYRDFFFDYDFTNIFRSTQDADLVVDATPEQAQRLEDLIRQKLSFLQGSKEHWEVRLLRYDRVSPGGQRKLALLSNPDFLGQNTDSNSTGMIELTDPPPGEGVVRDLRDWENPLPFFLQDVSQGRLHYYDNPSHQETSRFKSGDNPKLFSVIRYLVKAFQYGLRVEGEDRRTVRGIIDGFDPGGEYAALSPWARGWLERYGPNLIRHAVDVEYAWNTLEELGLREKLISLSDPSRLDSLGWWLSREPLRTRPVGEGTGKTAGELGISVVAHETNNFLAYESITRNMTGLPNVLISRRDHPGETAALGDGFYTRRGREGARGTGLTIRFTVDPGAREGTDFLLDGEYVVVRNRSALRVIPESLDASLLQYFQMLRAGLRMDRNDRGVWMKLKRRMSIKQLPPGDEDELVALMAAALGELASRAPDPDGGGEADLPPILREWFSFPVSSRHPELVRQLIEEAPPATLSAVVRQILTGPHWASHPELVEAIIGTGKIDSVVVEHLLTLPVWKNHPELVRQLIAKGNSALNVEIVKRLLTQEDWSGHPDLLQSLLADPRLDLLIISQVLSRPFWGGHPELVETVLRRAYPVQAQAIALHLMGEPHWAGHPEWIRELLARGEENLLPPLARALAKPHWKDHPELALAWIDQLPASWPHPGVIVTLLRQPQWIGRPEMLQRLVEHGGDALLAVDPLLQEEPWRDSRLRELCGGASPGAECLAQVLRTGYGGVLGELSSVGRGSAPPRCR